MANPKIIPKKSTIASKIPLPEQLAAGEVSVNWADQIWHGKHPSTNAVVPIGAPAVHSHDELYSLDSSKHLELQNNGSLLINGSTTLTLPSASGTLATLDDIVGSVAGVSSVNTRTGAVTLNKADVGLEDVDNTSDASKPISAATQTALDGKANATHQHDYNDLLNKPTLATVATSGSYTDLSNKPTLGTAASTDSSAYATAAQGAKADLAVQKVPADASPVSTIRCMTQVEYDALGTYDAQTLYFIK